jgi:HD-GYP domain-containing protein (c-di-GMP phosphodiesterase class II)
MVQVGRGGTMSIDDTTHHVESILLRLREDAKSMMSVGRYEQYDAFTFGHSIRVCMLALNFAQQITDDPRTLHRIGLAALLHDVGKAWVPFEILHTKGRLTEDERDEMGRHAEYGAEMLLDATNSDPMSVAIAFGHHRTIDNGGYPQMLHQARLFTATKVVKICDVYEALTSVRPYKPRMSPIRAYRIMISMKGHFDPGLLGRFVQVNGIYPTGSRVRLTSGETARVSAQTSDIERPVVDLEILQDGEVVRGSHLVEVDLSQQVGDGRVGIERLLLDEGTESDAPTNGKG